MLSTDQFSNAQRNMFVRPMGIKSKGRVHLLCEKEKLRIILAGI